MAITFYGANLLDDGSVLNNNFVQFNIPKITNYYSNGNENTYVAPGYRTNARVHLASATWDTTPINWNLAFLNVFGRTYSDDNYDLLGKKVTFFYSGNVNSDKLGFTMKLVAQSGTLYRYFIGHEQNGIGFMISTDSNRNGVLAFLQNPTTGGSSFAELLANEEAQFSPGAVRNLLSVENMPICPYFWNERYDFAESMIMDNNSNSWISGLMSFNNWYTMLTGNYRSGNVIRLKLAGRYKGLEYIDLTLPIILENSEAKVYTLETDPFPDQGGDSTLPYKNYTTIEMQYGTDLLYLLDDFVTSKTYTIQLENGYIEIKYDKIYSALSSGNAWVMSIFHNEKALTYGSGELYCVSKEAGETFGGVRGLYLVCPPNYAAANTSVWKNMVGDLTAPYLYEYPNSPLAFFSEIYNKPYSSMGITYKGTSSGNLFPIFTTNFRNLDFGTVSESIGSYVAAYATSVEAIDKAWWQSFLEGALPRKEINVGDGSIGGGNSGSGGGAGGYDDSSDDGTGGGLIDPDDFRIIPGEPNPIPGDFKPEVGQLYTLFYLTSTGVQAIADAVWLEGLADWVKSKFSSMNPADLIMSLKLLPYFPSVSDTNYQITSLGGFTLPTPITCKECYSYSNFDLGTVFIEPYFDNFLDFNNTRIQMFLPFVGEIELSPSDVMNKTIHLRASIDNMAGFVVYNLTDSNDNIIGTWSGNCVVEIPVTSGNFTGRIEGAIQAGLQASSFMLASPVSSVKSGKIETTVKSGDVSTQITENIDVTTTTSKSGSGNIFETVGNALDANIGHSTGSSFSGVAGVLGPMRPCIRIVCNKSPLPADYKKIVGYPTNVSVLLSECEGYTEVQSVHLENMGIATSDEISQIEMMLHSGVIF